MRLHDTTLRMRELLIEREVELSPRHADGEAIYEGPGAHARQAWEAFRAVAVEPAFDPIHMWGGEQRVTNSGFLFEGIFSQGWPARHGSRGMPEHYELMFMRRFSVGEDGEMLGFGLTIFVPAADELRPLRDTLDGGDGGDDSDEAFVTGAKAWIAQIEASPAFTIPMTRHPAERFDFGIDGIG
jgi:hypothetical protein